VLIKEKVGTEQVLQETRRIQDEQTEIKKLVEDTKSQINFGDKFREETREEARERGKAEGKAELFEGQLKITRELMERISNKSEQQREIIS
jgi:Rad3-related DNA helicase